MVEGKRLDIIEIIHIIIMKQDKHTTSMGGKDIVASVLKGMGHVRIERLPGRLRAARTHLSFKNHTTIICKRKYFVASTNGGATQASHLRLLFLNLDHWALRPMQFGGS